MAPISPDFKWLGLQISDPIWNQDHLQTNLFLTVQNPEKSRFQNPAVTVTGIQMTLPSDYQTSKY